MKVVVDLRITPERVIARSADGKVWFDEPSLVALSPPTRSLPSGEIVAIGTEAQAPASDRRVVPALSLQEFNPPITAAVARYAYLAVLDKTRGWGILRILFDRVEVRLDMPGYRVLPEDAQRAFVAQLPRRPGLKWFVNGQPAGR